MNERPIPPAALKDADSVEMIRVWIADHGIHCSLKIGMYKDTTNISEGYAWGVMLSDITRHVASALSEGYGDDRSKTITEIRNAYNGEITKPTSEVDGQFT